MASRAGEGRRGSPGFAGKGACISSSEIKVGPSQAKGLIVSSVYKARSGRLLEIRCFHPPDCLLLNRGFPAASSSLHVSGHIVTFECTQIASVEATAGGGGGLWPVCWEGGGPS